MANEVMTEGATTPCAGGGRVTTPAPAGRRAGARRVKNPASAAAVRTRTPARNPAVPPPATVQDSATTAGPTVMAMAAMGSA